MQNDPLRKAVKDRASFAVFAGTLLQSLQTEPETWENTSLESFLEALQRYTLDLQGYYNHTDPGQNADIPSWKAFADILNGASVYE